MISSVAELESPGRDRISSLISGDGVAAYIEGIEDPARKRELRRRIEDAADWLITHHGDRSDQELQETLKQLLPRLQSDQVQIFFSYKHKDMDAASRIAAKLKSWSNGRVKILHMGDFGVEHVGRDWRERIEHTIPECDCFLMLLPSPGDDRDWVLYEAGYFSRGQGLAGRLICLHHPDNEVSDALGSRQSVPAEIDSVKNFLSGMFREPNWVPGMDALNPKIDNLEEKAKEIVGLVRPRGHSVTYCCGPHIELSFADAEEVTSAEDVYGAVVVDSNEACRSLFGLTLPPRHFGEWLQDSLLEPDDTTWARQLAASIQAAAKGRRVPPVEASLTLRAAVPEEENRCIQPIVCAVRRSSTDQRVQSIDVLFQDIDSPSLLSTMKPELSALAMSMEIAVRFRYQLLEPFMGKELDKSDIKLFGREHDKIIQYVLTSGRWLNPSETEEKVLSLFSGVERQKLEQIYARSHQIWPQQGEGLLAEIRYNDDVEGLKNLLKELNDMNNSFLGMTSARFAQVMAEP